MNQSPLRAEAQALGAHAQKAMGGAGTPTRHESAHLHVTGEAVYTDDMPELRDTLHGAFGLSQRAHARVTLLQLDAVRAAPGVRAVLTATDVRGINNYGAVAEDDPILADGVVEYYGQPLFLVVADSVDQARKAQRLAQVEYEELPAILTIEDALAAGSLLLPTVTLECGDAVQALAQAPHRLKGRLRIGGQEHFYLEGQVAYAVPREDGTLHVHSSTQHPGDVQFRVARALARAAKDVTVECRRMGGAFGGKESQAALLGCAAALAAVVTARPVKIRLDRDDDFLITGKRHDFVAEYEVGFDSDGRIVAADLMLASRCGYSTDLSRSVNDRAVLHADNCYAIDNFRIVSRRLKTHTQSATAFRGFGVPQGMLAAEQLVDEVARHLGLDPLEVRKRNLYGRDGRNVTHYGQTLEDFIVPELLAELESSAQYAPRRHRIAEWNRSSPVIKRGIAMLPIKFGIAYTGTFLNQGSAVVSVFEDDGSVLVNHGGTEMGQGLFTKVAQVVAEEFSIDVDRVRATASDTSRIPNASATSASSGSDINGKAAQDAARKVKDRLAQFAATRFGVGTDSVRFDANRVFAGDQDIGFAELVRLAYMGRVQLWDSGFYSTPKVAYDRAVLKGRPYLYFSYGAAVTEVAIDTMTGESKVLRVDLLHDAGRSLNPAIDIGQVEGGYVQGLGWLTSEELVWDDVGRLMTHAPSTYKIPVASDVPADWHVKLYEQGVNVEDTIHRSKGIGEPPLTLALSAFFAIKDAVAAAGDHCVSPQLNAPATPQEILSSVDDVRRRTAHVTGTQGESQQA
jgi:xanthine dehydrogenase large subunit